MLFQIVVERFIGVSLSSIPSSTMLQSAVVSTDMLVSIIGTNPFIIPSFREETKFVINTSINPETLVFPIFLIPMVYFIHVSLGIVNPSILRPIEKICSIPMFSNCFRFISARKWKFRFLESFNG
jgi:hypothetical protein